MQNPTLDLENLPEANLLQKSDFVPVAEQGLALGGVTGILAELVAVGVLLATTLTGAGVGAWLSSMVGMSLDNRRIKEFEEAIQSGELLVLADVPTNRVNKIEKSIK